MRTMCGLLVAGVVVGAVVVRAQEKPVPKDSTRVTIPGCVRGSTLIAATPRGIEKRGPVNEGQRFRMAAKKDVIRDIGKHKDTMVEVTGIVRTSQYQPGGVSVLGGRVRIGGAMP